MISKLRMRRLSLELTMIRIQIVARVSPSRLSLIERGLAQPTAAERRRLAEALLMDERELFSMDEQSTTSTAGVA